MVRSEHVRSAIKITVRATEGLAQGSNPLRQMPRVFLYAVARKLVSGWDYALCKSRQKWTATMP